MRPGTAGDAIAKILASLKPEAVYFTEQNGRRGAVLLLEVASPFDGPRFAEPFFSKYNGDCRFRIVMSPKELAKAGLGELGKRWV